MALRSRTVQQATIDEPPGRSDERKDRDELFGALPRTGDSSRIAGGPGRLAVVGRVLRIPTVGHEPTEDFRDRPREVGVTPPGSSEPGG